MQIYPDKLSRKLDRSFCNRLLVYGGEAQQTKDCIDLYHAICKKHGFTEKVLIDAKDGIDWNLVMANNSNLDMFTSNKLLEVNLCDFKQFTKLFNDKLHELLINLSDNYAVLIICDHLPASLKQANWFNLFEKKYLVTYAGNGSKNQIKNYLQSNLQEHGFKIEANALDFLTNCCINNFYLANQISQKLAILYPSKLIIMDDLQDIDEAAIFSAYNLMDLIHSANLSETLHCFTSLKEQQIEPSLILFVLTQVVKAMLALSKNLQNKNNTHAEIFKQYNIWDNKQANVLKKAQQLQFPALSDLLNQCRTADLILKGQKSGNIWVNLQKIILHLLGIETVFFAEA
jgi:DNA polymerase III subunit delta